jgi:phage-related minor tail protein
MGKIIELIIEDVFKSTGGLLAAKTGIQDVTKAADDSGKSISTMDDTLSNTGSKMGETGKKVGAAVGIAVGGALTAGFVSSVSFDESQHKLEASFAQGSEQSKVAGEAAGKLYAEGYQESMDEISQAVKQVIQSGDEMRNASVEQVQTITGQFLSLAKVMNIDVSSAIESVATMVKTKMAPDTQAGLDLVTAAYQAMGPAAEGVIGAVQKNAEEFQRLGIDGKEAMGLIKQGMDAGAGSADAVASSFKLFTNTVLSGSKASEEGLKALGLATDVLGPKSTKAGSAASASFTVASTEADKARQVIENMGLSVDSISSKADKSGKTTSESFKVTGASVAELQTKLDDAGITMSSFSDKLATGSKTGANALKVIGINADDIRGKIAAGGDTANSAFSEIITKLQGIKDPLQQNTVGTELFGKSWKTVSESILAFKPDTAVQGLGQINGAAENMNKTVEDTAQNKLTQMKNRFQEFLANIVNAPGILGTVTTSFAALGTGGLGALASIAQIASSLPEGFTKMSTDMISSTAKVVGSFIMTSASAVVEAGITAGAWIAANIAMIAATGGIVLAVGAVILIGYEVIKHWGEVKDFFGGVADFLDRIGSSMWDGIKDGARMMVNVVVEYLNVFVEAINAVISGADLVPGVSIPHIPHIPMASFAGGGISSGGLALVGEQGPELVSLPGGSRVFSNSESRSMAGSGSSEPVVIKIDSGGSSLDDFLIKLLRKFIRSSGGNVQVVLGSS